MKTKIILPLLLAGAGLPVAAAAVSPFVVTAPRSFAHDLALSVSVAPAVHPFKNEDARGNIEARIQDAFTADGFKGGVDVLTADERRELNLPLLEINVIDWQANPSLLADCAFTARLVTPAGVTPLGTFDGSSLLPPAGGVHDARDAALNQAATDAIDNLYHALRRGHLLPDRGA